MSKALSNPSGLSPSDRRNLVAALESELQSVLDADEKSKRDCQLAIANILWRIREDKLFDGTHKTFEAYCDDRWGFTKQRAGQLIGFRRVSLVVENSKQTVYQATRIEGAATRALASLGTDAQIVKAIDRAVKASGDGEPTHEQVANAVKEIKFGVNGAPAKPAPKPPKAPPPTPVAKQEPAPPEPEKDDEPDDGGGYEPEEAKKGIAKALELVGKLVRAKDDVKRIVGNTSHLQAAHDGIDAANRAFLAQKKAIR